jgi:hypothetical protein
MPRAAAPDCPYLGDRPPPRCWPRIVVGLVCFVVDGLYLTCVCGDGNGLTAACPFC